LGDLTPHVGVCLAVEPDPAKAAALIIRHVEEKRRGLGLDARIAP